MASKLAHIYGTVLSIYNESYHYRVRVSTGDEILFPNSFSTSIEKMSEGSSILIDYSSEMVLIACFSDTRLLTHFVVEKINCKLLLTAPS